MANTHFNPGHLGKTRSSPGTRSEAGEKFPGWSQGSKIELGEEQSFSEGKSSH